MPKIFVKPRAGADGQPLKVRLEDRPREFLPADGDWVEGSSYWTRRLRDASVVEAKPPKAAKPAAAKE